MTSQVPPWIIPAEHVTADQQSPLGGATSVFMGTWQDGVVAVRLLPKEVTSGLLFAHIQRWESVKHANVLHIFGVSSADADPLFIVSQCHANGNVNQFLTNNPTADRAKIIYETAIGMQFLHGNGLVHGSLKPTNILITDFRQACVADGGMVQVTPSTNPFAHHYFSPEAWKGSISRPSDVFAFAMSAFEIFTGSRPWGVLSETQVYQLVVREGERPDRPDQDLEERVGLTDQIWGIIEEAWSKEPRLRPAFDHLVNLWHQPPDVEETISTMLEAMSLPVYPSPGSSNGQGASLPVTPSGLPLPNSSPSYDTEDDLGTMSPATPSFASGPPAYNHAMDPPPHAAPLPEKSRYQPAAPISPPQSPYRASTSSLPTGSTSYITSAPQLLPFRPGTSSSNGSNVPRRMGSASPGVVSTAVATYGGSQVSSPQPMSPPPGAHYLAGGSNSPRPFQTTLPRTPSSGASMRSLPNAGGAGNLARHSTTYSQYTTASWEPGASITHFAPSPSRAPGRFEGITSIDEAQASAFLSSGLDNGGVDEMGMMQQFDQRVPPTPESINNWGGSMVGTSYDRRQSQSQSLNQHQFMGPPMGIQSDRGSIVSGSQYGTNAAAGVGSPSAVLLAGALLAETTEGRKPAVVDALLIKIHDLANQSDKEAQKLITAGTVNTLILLLKARAVDVVGLEIVLMTLGTLAHDSISSNMIYRTSAATTLLEILDSSLSDDIAAATVWCLNRICRSSEVASGLIKQGLVTVLVQKGLNGTHTTSRLSAWCLGGLIRSDNLAETLSAQGIVSAAVEHLKSRTDYMNVTADDVCAAIFLVARMARTIKLSKALVKVGCVEPLVHYLRASNHPKVLNWSARAVGCLMRPNSSDMSKILLDAGAAHGLARLPRVLPTEEIEPLASFAFAIQRFSCAEWGGGTRKALVEAGVVDSLLSALRTAADVPYPQVHIELALAVSFLGDVGGSAIRKEIVRAGGIDILKRVGAAGKPEVEKVCGMAVTSITGNLWTRNAASAKTAMAHNWSGGCPDHHPECPFVFGRHVDPPQGSQHGSH